ncbi:hypothetical protein C3984_01209 [Escherichia coli]|nr:hypothetical protein C3984_01209 [Escherichia coli]
MYYIHTDCTYTRIAIEYLLYTKYFNGKGGNYDVNIYDLRNLKLENVVCYLIQRFKERRKINIIFICTDKFIHNKRKPRNVFFLDANESIRNWDKHIRKLRYCNGNLLICFLFLCSLYHISIFTGKKQIIIACIKKGFSFSEITNFLKISARTLINYLGGLTSYFILPYSDYLYKYINDRIIASFGEEYRILSENQRKYYV